MFKRTWAIVAGVALLASMFTVGTAMAQDAPAPAVPAEPNIVDPKGDANFINSGQAAPLGQDNTTPADASTVADILAVWFTEDANKVSAHIQTEAPPPAANGTAFNVYASPGEGAAGSNTTGCVRFWLVLPGSNPNGGTWAGPPVAKLHDRCNTGGNVWDSPDVEYSVAKAEDGTGIVTITAPRDLSPLFVAGQKLATPTAATSSPAFGTDGSAFTPFTDNTKPGTDYTVTGGGGGGGGTDPGTDPGDGDGGDDDGTVDEPKKDKKDCKKAKGKKAKKKCKKKNKGNNGGGEEPKGDSCAAYVPGEEGAEAETFVVKDEHTAEAPLEITIEQDIGGAGDLGIGLYDGASHTFRNLQVDSKAADAGLYIRYEFPVYEDHDLYVNYPDGSEAAHVGGFNMTPVSIFDGTGAGGHSEQGAEQIDGLRTADCAGYTVDFSNYLGEGGEYTVKVWLGEVQNEPAAPGGGR